MININTFLVENLTELLPIPLEYELFLDESTTIPCVSYQVTQNTEVAQGTINGYSRIIVRFKIWAQTVRELCEYSEQLDDAVASLGTFQRSSVGDMYDGSLLCRIVDYTILIPEKYNNARYT